MHHGVTFNFGSAKVCSAAILETSFSYDKYGMGIIDAIFFSNLYGNICQRKVQRLWYFIE